MVRRLLQSCPLQQILRRRTSCQLLRRLALHLRLLLQRLLLRPLAFSGFHLLQ